MRNEQMFRSICHATAPLNDKTDRRRAGLSIRAAGLPEGHAPRSARAGYGGIHRCGPISQGLVRIVLDMELLSGKSEANRRSGAPRSRQSGLRCLPFRFASSDTRFTGGLGPGDSLLRRQGFGCLPSTRLAFLGCHRCGCLLTAYAPLRAEVFQNVRRYLFPSHGTSLPPL
jgi:hypothetical protein